MSNPIGTAVLLPGETKVVVDVTPREVTNEIFVKYTIGGNIHIDGPIVTPNEPLQPGDTYGVELYFNPPFPLQVVFTAYRHS